MSKPWIIAHRGASGNFPENTLLAFEEAIKRGADIIELDLQLTSDGEIVVFHDRTVERIFGKYQGKRIADFSLNELQNLDAGTWFNKKYQNLKIPSLREVFKFVSKEVSLILEIKSRETILLEKTLNLLSEEKRKLNLGYLAVRDVHTVKKIRELSDFHKIGLMQKQRRPEELISLVIENDIEIVQIRWKNWIESNWKKLKEMDITITAFFADRIKEYRFLINKGINGILTNYPEKLQKYLEEIEAK